MGDTSVYLGPSRTPPDSAAVGQRAAWIFTPIRNRIHILSAVGAGIFLSRARARHARSPSDRPTSRVPGTREAASAASAAAKGTIRML